MRDAELLEHQDLEYAIGLIADIEREESDEIERVGTDRSSGSVEPEEKEEEEEEQRVVNPSPGTLRRIRQAYFQGVCNESPSGGQSRRPRAVAPQAHLAGKRLRSGRSY